MQSEGGRAAAEVGKGIALAAVCTLAMVLIFALFIKLFSIGSSVIVPVNQDCLLYTSDAADEH